MKGEILLFLLREYGADFWCSKIIWQDDTSIQGTNLSIPGSSKHVCCFAFTAGFFSGKKKAQTLHTKGKSRYIPTKHLGQGLDMLGLHHPDASPIQRKYIFRISYHMNQFSLALHKQGVFSGEPTRIIWEMLWVGPLLTLSICSWVLFSEPFYPIDIGDFNVCTPPKKSEVIPSLKNPQGKLHLTFRSLLQNYQKLKKGPLRPNCY